jgi:hypothetical protein
MGRFVEMFRKIVGWTERSKTELKKPEHPERHVEIPRTGVAGTGGVMVDPLDSFEPFSKKIPPSHARIIANAKGILQILEIMPELYKELPEFFENAFATASLWREEEEFLLVLTEAEVPAARYGLARALIQLVEVTDERGVKLDVLGIEERDGKATFVIFYPGDVPPTIRLAAHMPGGQVIKSQPIYKRGRVLPFRASS